MRSSKIPSDCKDDDDPETVVVRMPKRPISDVPPIVSAPPRFPFTKFELKVNQVWSDAATRVAGYVYCLNKTAEGAELSTRSGRDILMQYVDIVGLCYPPASGGYTDCGRLLVVYDKVPNIATPAIGDILESSVISSMYLEPSNIYSYPTRFTVLLDYHWGPSVGAYCTDHSHLIKHIKIPKKCQHTHYASELNTVPSEGGLFIVLCSQVMSGTDNQNCRLGYSAVLRFSDM